MADSRPSANPAPETWAPEVLGADARESRNSWDSLVMNRWPNSEGTLAWVLYLLASAFLASDDRDSVWEILEILRPLDANLAALLSSRVVRSN